MIEAALWLLGQFHIKAFLLTAASFLVFRCARRQSALLRQWVLRMSIVALLLLPATSLMGPKIKLSVEGLGSEQAALLPAAAKIVTNEGANASRQSTPPPTNYSQTNPSLPEPKPTGPGGRSPGELFGWTLLIMYASGVVLLLLRLLYLVARVQKQVNQLAPVTNERLSKKLVAISHALGIKALPLFKMQGANSTPFVWGILRPTVVVPGDFHQWPSSAQQSTLIHELVHIRKRDFAFSLLARFCCCFYWPNPLVWRLTKALSLANEQACDDEVLARSRSAEAYAECLVHIAKRLRSPGAVIESLAPSITGESSLGQRIASILNAQQRRNTMNRFALATFAAGFASLSLVTFAVESPRSTEPDHPPPFKRDASAQDSDFALLHRVHPSYPEAAKNNKLTGYVVLEFDIAATGAVENVRVVESEPAQVFDRASIDAAEEWLYLPKYVQGKAQRSERVRTKLSFALGDPNQSGLESLPLFSVSSEQLSSASQADSASSDDLAALYEHLKGAKLDSLSASQVETITAIAQRLAEAVGSGEGYIVLASIHERRKEWPQAQLALAKAFEKGKLTDLTAARFQVARVLYHSNQYDRSQQILQSLAAANPQHMAIQSWLSAVQIEAKRVNRVAEHLASTAME